jgi:hypothetical protein
MRHDKMGFENNDNDSRQGISAVLCLLCHFGSGRMGWVSSMG